MITNTLIFLYNPDTNLYIESHDKINISWSMKWSDAEDFSSIFFLSRLFLRLKLQKISGAKLKWKRWLVYEGRGVM